MKALTRLMVIAAAAGTAGCGKTDKSDNSAIQTPDDQPIGPPKGFRADGKTGGQQLGEQGGPKRLKTVELKD